MLKLYEVRANNKLPPEDKIPVEVYLLNGDEEENLDWKCPIEVARLAGLEIVKEEHNGVDRYFVRRMPYKI